MLMHQRRARHRLGVNIRDDGPYDRPPFSGRRRPTRSQNRPGDAKGCQKFPSPPLHLFSHASRQEFWTQSTPKIKKMKVIGWLYNQAQPWGNGQIRSKSSGVTAFP
jgi:hypothetical protein